MLKKIIFPVLTLVSLTTQAAELKHVPELVQAVSNGEELVFVVSLPECKAEFPLKDIKFSFKPNALIVTDDKQVIVTDNYLTLDEPGYKGTPVYDYTKYNFNVDGSTNIQLTVMDPRSYKTLAIGKINCELGKGIKVFSARAELIPSPHA